MLVAARPQRKGRMTQLNREKFAARVKEIERAIYRRHHALPPLRVLPEDEVRPGVVPGASDGAGAPELEVGGQWGSYNRTFWLLGEVVVPAEWAGETVLLLLRLGERGRIEGPEALAYVD